MWLLPKTVRCNFETARLRKRSQQCCFKNWRCFKSVKITGRECPVIWIRLPPSRSPKIMEQYDSSCGSIGKKLVRTSNTRVIVGMKTHRSSVTRRTGKSNRMGMLKYASEKSSHVFQCTWKRKNGGQRSLLETHLVKLMNKIDLEEPTNYRPSIPGMYSARNRHKQKILWWRSRNYSTGWYHPKQARFSNFNNDTKHNVTL